MKLLHFFIISIISTLSIQSYAKSVALSFDDGMNPNKVTNAHLINEKILNQLDQANVKSIVFPSYIKIGDAKGKALIRNWGNRGHIIANHSAFHENLNLSVIDIEQYIESIKINELIFKDLPNFHYIYRYPFLKEGNTLQKREKVKHWLKEHHYQNGAVSIDASDWFYNQKYTQYEKLNDNGKLKQLKKAYITHLLNRADYYDKLAFQVLGRSPKHVLLLHTNAINGAYLTDIITSFQNEGWSIISPQDAYKDPLYQESSQNIPAGESIIWSIAKTKGISNLRYPAEDAPYEIENLEKYQIIDEP